MANMIQKPQKQQFMRIIGADTRAIREHAGISCERVAKVLNRIGNRDRISKFERGISSMDMFEYLKMMWWLRDFVPSHPAVALAKMTLPPDVLAGDYWDSVVEPEEPEAV